MNNDFSYTILEYINNAVRNTSIRPLNLGGIAASGGGSGTPPGGFVGYLPQTRVAYDISESSSTTASGSLLDNLNHMRYRLDTVEGTIVLSGGGHVILDEGVAVTPRINLDFVGGGVVVTDNAELGTTVVTIEGGTDYGVLDIITVAANTTLDSTHSTILVNATTGNKTITLPSAASYEGKVYNIGKIDSTTYYVIVSGTIDGVSSVYLRGQYENVTLQSDGTQWYMLKRPTSTFVPEGGYLQIGGNVYPTTSQIRFGDSTYVVLYEKTDDVFAIKARATDALILDPYGDTYIGRVSGTVLKINSTGFTFNNNVVIAGDITANNLLEEAPEDGDIYARQDAGWVLIPSGTFVEAPETGLIYGRKDGAWEVVSSGVIEEAPETGFLYGRQDGAWELVNTNVVEEAPVDGYVYGRQNGSWITVSGESGHVIYDEGTEVSQTTNLNFVGDGVNVTTTYVGTEVNYDVELYSKLVGDNHPYTSVSGYFPLNNAYYGRGQTFTAITSDYITSCGFYLKKVGSPTGNMYAVLYKHQGTFGTNGTPFDPALATSDAIDVSTLSTAAAITEFVFSTPYLGNSTTPYCIVISYENGDADNYISAGYDSDPNHDGNYVYRETDSTWVADANYDLSFYIFTDILEREVSSDVDAGFVNTEDGGDTYPFTAGEVVSYTVQSGLTNGTWLWRARAKTDVLLSEWTEKRSFLADDSDTLELLEFRTFTAEPDDLFIKIDAVTADKYDFGTDTTPTIEFEGSDLVAGLSTTVVTISGMPHDLVTVEDTATINLSLVGQHLSGVVIASGIDHTNLSGLEEDSHPQYIKHDLATAENDFIVASGNGVFFKKTLAETGAILESDIEHDNLQSITGTVGEYNHPTDANMVVLGNTSNTNTGDQVSDGITISGVGTVGDPFAVIASGVDHDLLLNYNANEHYVQTDITNVDSDLGTGLLKVTTGMGALSVAASGIDYVEVEIDPVFVASEAYNIDSGDITNLGNLSGTNTGDQVGDGVTILGLGTVADPFVATISGMGGIVGSGIIGQVAEFVTDTKTLQAAKIIGPASNILTLTNAAASTLALAITSLKTLTLTSTDTYGLTIAGDASIIGTNTGDNSANSLYDIGSDTQAWSAVLDAFAGGTDVTVAQGGTGVATLADGGLIVGNAANAVEVVAAGLTTQILVGGGALTNPAWGTDLPTAITIGTKYIYRADGTDVPVADGGTGASTFALNGVLYGNAANALGVTAIGAQYKVLTVGGTPFVPVFSSYLLDGTSGGKTSLAVTSGKTLTLTAADDYNVTIPSTGTMAMLNDIIMTTQRSWFLT